MKRLIPVLLLLAAPALATVTLPYSFNSGTTVDASKVNANDGALRDEINTHEGQRNGHSTRLQDILTVGNSCNATSIDFNLTQGLNFRLENLTSDPTCNAGAKGRVFFNSTSGTFKVCDGSVWTSIAGAGSATFADNAFSVYDNSDATKIFNVDSGGTTGTQTTLTTAQTANRVITLPDATTTLVGTDATQTLTNKTISGASNTLSNIGYSSLTLGGNIVDADLNAAAAVQRSKLASGTANHVVINGGTGALSSEAQLATSRGGTGQDMSAQTGLVKVSGGTMSAATLVNSDVSASAAIARSKLANGTADHVLINDASGVVSSEAALAVSRGGTGQTTANAGLNALLPSQTGNAGKTLTTDGSNASWGTGGGAGGIFAGGQNLLTNNSFESSVGSWTASSGTFARTTTNGQFIPPGIAGAHWDGSGAADGTLVYDAITINANDGIAGRSGVVSCSFRCATGTCQHTITAYDGTNNLVVPQTITSSTTNWQRTSVNFSFPASGTVQLKIAEKASTDEPDLFIDDCYMGLAENFNLSQVSQATMYGAARWVAAASCAWTTGNTGAAYTDFGADTDCNSPTLTAAAAAPLSGTKTPRIAFATLPPGQYMVVATGVFLGETTAVTATLDFALYDGSTVSGVSQHGINSSTSTDHRLSGALVGRFSYSTTQTNIEFRPVALSTSNSNDPLINAASSGEDLEIHVYRFPTSAEIAYRPELYNWRVDANISGANISLGTGNTASYSEMTNGSLTLTNNTSSGANILTAQIACASGTASTGTTCSSNESNGIAFNLPVAGDVEACAYFTHYSDVGAAGAVGDTETAFQIVETTNTSSAIVQEGKSRIEHANIINTGNSRHIKEAPFSLCGTFSFTSAGQKTLRVEFEQLVSGTVTASQVLADAGSSNGQRDIHWVVKPLTQQTPMPIIVGGTPTVQTFTSGTAATYTTPVGARYLKVTVVGGGGGGAGAGGAPTAGTAGNSSSFGSSLLTAAGGGGGATSGGSGDGGAATCNSPAKCITTAAGTRGHPAYANVAGAGGGGGGASTLGGAGSGGTSGIQSCQDAKNNSGSGGGGAHLAGGSGGGGGGGGATVVAIIANPSSTYTYTVGGTASGGTGTNSGCIGAGGYISVEEYYQ